MKLKIPQTARRRTLPGLLASTLATIVAAAMVVLTPAQASAIATAVPLGTAASFSVLAGSGVTNTGATVISHDLGTAPTPSITGFPPGLVLGSVHAADAVALQAKSDLVTAYNNAAGQATDFALPAAITTGTTLIPGVYTATAGVGLTGDLILDAQGDPNAVWVFQIPEALTTATASRVLLTNGASPCNVYWQIGSSATLGTNSTFVGTIMALTSITVTTGTNIEGRALARNGAVTLDDNRIFLNNCATTTTGGTTTGGTTTTGTTTGTTVGVTGGNVITGGLVGGPIVGTGGTGNVSGNTAGNTVGNTAGNNVTSGNTSGNTAGEQGNKPGEQGNKPGEHDNKPGGPDHGGGHDQHGKPSEEYQGGPGKPENGKPENGKPENGEDNGHDYANHDSTNYGYANAPKSEGQEGHEGHEGHEG